MPKAADGPIKRLWHERKFGRRRWRFYLTSKLYLDGEEKAGLCMPGRAEVVVHACQKAKDIVRTTNHELVHVWHDLGRGERAELVNEAEWEENAAVLFEVGGPTVLAAYGFKLPPMPKWLASFRAECRRFDAARAAA